MAGSDDAYLAREAKARKKIDEQLVLAGWVVQGKDEIDVNAGPGVAIREFALEKPHGRVDYLLFVEGQPAGVIEAKPEGTTLVEVEHQTGKYVDGLPEWMEPPVYPLPFIYESTGSETRFTNGYDPDARSRRVFTFHRPETLAEWSRQIVANPAAPTFRARLKSCPRSIERGLWEVQAEAITNLEQSLARGSSAVADPDGDGFGEDVHRRERLLPADQPRRREADLVPGRPIESRQAGEARVRQVRRSRRRSASSPPSTTSST